VRSQVGKGSCFSIELPQVEICNQTEMLNAEKNRFFAQKIHFQPARLLLVDDIESNRLLIKTYLNHHPELQIIEACNGEQALALIATQPFDLILMDRRLPDLEGDSVCEKIRAMPDKAIIPIIMITASVIMQPEEQRSPFYNLQLNKPIAKADLLVAMQTFLPLDDHVEIASQLSTPKTVKVYERANVENLAELVELLRSVYQKRIVELNSSGAVQVDTFIEIAEQLLEIAQQYHYSPLYEWANTLKTQSELFDLASLPKTLSCFDDLIDNLVP
jgi:CheY-like chemotaxis protein